MFSLRLFGPPTLVGEDGPLNGRAAQRHRLGLLALLSTAPGHQLSRDKLLAYLWPDADAKRARHLLNVSVHVLRKELGEDALVSVGDDVRLDPAIVRSDVAAFEEAIAEGEAERAVELYAAPFLDGFYVNGSAEFERWLDGERDRLAGLYERALESLATEAEADGDAEAAVEWWRRLAVHNPYSGRIAAGLMRALEAAGDHGAAIRHGCAHAALLREELGAEPDPQVVVLAERLKAEPNSHNGNGADQPAAGPTPDIPARSRAPTDSQPEPFSSTGGRNGRVARRAILVAGLLIATAVSVVLLWQRQRPQLDRNRILVASFQNRTGDASLDGIGHMAADWIQQGLARTELVVVIDQATALLSSNHVADTGKLEDRARVGALADETGAGTIVSGSFYRDRDSLVFMATVADANSGEIQLALAETRSPIDDPILGIDRLRGRVMGALATLFDERLASLTATSGDPPTYEAYLEFMKGLDGYGRRDYSAAAGHFRRAASLDTTFYLALLWHARSLGYWGWNTAELLQRDSVMRVLVQKREHMAPLDRYAVDFYLAEQRHDRNAQLNIARQAAELAPRSDWSIKLAGLTNRLEGPRAAIAMLEGLDPDRGWLKDWAPYWEWVSRGYHLLGEHDRELDAIRKGRKRHPADPRLWAFELGPYSATGNVDEIERLIDEYIQLPPQSPFTPGGFMWSAGQELRAHGYPEAGLELVERAVAWYEARPPDAGDEVAWKRHRWSLALALYGAGRLEKARSLFEELVEEMPDGSLGYLGSIAALQGDRATAERYSARLRDEVEPERRAWAAYYQARIAALLGDEEEALALLGEAAADVYLPFWLHRDPEWEAMRGKPEIQKMMRPWEEPRPADEITL